MPTMNLTVNFTHIAEIPHEKSSHWVWTSHVLTHVHSSRYSPEPKSTRVPVDTKFTGVDIGLIIEIMNSQVLRTLAHVLRTLECLVRTMARLCHLDIDTCP